MPDPTPRPLTTLILSKAMLFDKVADKLKPYPGWRIYKYRGSNFRRLFQLIPELQLPCCALAYEGSRYYVYPEVANTRLHAIVAVRETRNMFDDGFVGATVLAEKAMDLLDQQILPDSHAVVFAASDEQIDVGEGVSCIDVELEIKDH